MLPSYRTGASLALMISLIACPPSVKGSTRGPLPDVDSNSKFLIYYGNDYGTANLNLMKTFDVVVLNPNLSSCTPRVVKELQEAGAKYVFGYISIGEDFVGGGESLIAHTGTGPVYKDEVTGQMVEQNGGVASFYVDADYKNGAYEHDGIADKNPKFKGYFINPNADWRWIINVMRIGGNNGVFTDRQYKAGLQQIAGDRGTDIDSRTENFGFDGFFLDTLDTAGPYTGHGYYPWSIEEMKDTVKFISDTYTTKAILANRGLFFYQPGLHSATYDIWTIEHSIRPYVDVVLFESYKLDSAEAHTGQSPYYTDNKYNNAPKLMAEGNRFDGFTVTGIDYMMDRGQALYQATFDETVGDYGWVEYLSARGEIDTVDTFISDRLPLSDTTPPTWMNTGTGFNVTSTPRVGVQKLIKGDDPTELTVQWDAAADQSWPVKYNIYLSTQADFSSPVQHSAVAFETTPDWIRDPANNAANQFKLTGLAAGTYYVRVRAEDSSAGNLEDDNTVTLATTLGGTAVSNPVPEDGIVLDGNSGDWDGLQDFGLDPDEIPGTNDQTDWRRVWMAHDSDQIFMAYQNDVVISINWGYIAYIDTDGLFTTGFRGAAGEFPIGAEYMINGYELWRYVGGGTDWSWEFVDQLGRSWNGPYGEMSMWQGWLGYPNSLQLFFVGDNSVYGGTEMDYYPDGALTNGEFFRYNLY